MFVLAGVLLLLTALLPGGVGVGAQSAPLTLELSGVNALELPRVEITANVYDALGQPLNGLTAEDFRISGALAGYARIVSVQNIASNALPFATVLVIDASESMAGEPIERARAAARAYVENVRDTDPVAVIAFGSTVQVLQDFTTDKAALLAAIDSIDLLGRTALYQAAYEGINLAKDSPVPRRTVILLSDGSEYGGLSQVTPDEVIEDAFLHGVPGYTVGLGYGAERSFLQALAGETLAQYYESPTADELQAIYQALADRLSSQYIITLDVDVPLDGTEYGFVLTAEHDGETASQAGTIRAPIPVPIIDLGGLPADAIADVTDLAIEVRADQNLTRVVEALGGAVVADLTDPPYTLRIDPEAYPPGPLTLEVSATDVDGDTGTGSATLEIAALPPRISLSRDLAEMGAIPEPIEITIFPGGQTPVTEVSLSINGGDPVILEAPYTFTLDPLALPPGDNHLDVTVRNQAGLEATYPADFIIADVPPVVSIEGLTDGQSVDTPVSFSVGAVSQTPVSQVSAALNGVPLLQVDGVFTLDPMTTRPGAAELTVSATTDRGQTGEAAITLMIVPLPPILTVDGLSDGDTLLGSLDITLNAVAQTPVTQGQVLVNGALVAQLASTPVTITLPFSAMQPNENDVLIQVQTAAGQTGELALTIIVPPELFTPTPNVAATGTASAYAAATRTSVAQAAANEAATQSAATQSAVQAEQTAAAASTRSAVQTMEAAAFAQAQTVTAEASAARVAATQAAATAATETAVAQVPTATVVPPSATPQPASATSRPASATPRPATATPIPASATPIPATATAPARATSDAPATVQAAAALVQQAATNARATVNARQTATQAAQATVQAQATQNAQATLDAVAQAANATTTAAARATAQVSTDQTATALAQDILTATAQIGRTATAEAAATTAARANATAAVETQAAATALAATQAVGTANAQAADQTATASAASVAATAGAQATRTARAVRAAETATAAVTAEATAAAQVEPASPTPQPTLTPVEAEPEAGGGTTAMLWLIFIVILLITVLLVVLITRARKRRMEQ